MSVLWKKIKTSTGKSTLEKMGPGDVTLERPTVLFLTGVSTTMSQPQYVAGAISHVHDMIDTGGANKSADTDVYAWSYKSKRSNFKSVFMYNALPDTYFSNHGRQFVYDFLLPHFAENIEFDKKGRLKSADPIDVKEVAEKFRNLTLLAYSYGSVFSQEVYNAAYAVMQDIGYSEKNARFMLSRIHQVSLGAVSRPIKEKDRFTSICLVATNDRVSNHKRRLYWSFKELSAAYTKTLKINKLSKRNWYISAPVQKDLWEQKQDPEGNIVMRNVVRPLFPKWWIRHSHHELPHYTTDQDESNQFAKMARFALINCVNRKHSLLASEMIAPPKSLIGRDAKFDQECENYKKRIKKAMNPGK